MKGLYSIMASPKSTSKLVALITIATNLESVLATLRKSPEVYRDQIEKYEAMLAKIDNAEFPTMDSEGNLIFQEPTTTEAQIASGLLELDEAIQYADSNNERITLNWMNSARQHFNGALKTAREPSPDLQELRVAADKAHRALKSCIHNMPGTRLQTRDFDSSAVSTAIQALERCGAGTKTEVKDAT